MLWQEQDVTITKLRHQIDEAEVEISRQSKLIQSQALELEEIGPCSEFLCKHEVSFIQSETKALRVGAFWDEEWREWFVFTDANENSDPETSLVTWF